MAVLVMIWVVVWIVSGVDGEGSVVEGKKEAVGTVRKPGVSVSGVNGSGATGVGTTSPEHSPSKLFERFDLDRDGKLILRTVQGDEAGET